MAFYENTIVARQDLAENRIKTIKFKIQQNNQQLFWKSY